MNTRCAGDPSPALQLAKSVAAVSGPKMVEFRRVLLEPRFAEPAAALRREVETFAGQFPLPGLGDI